MNSIIAAPLSAFTNDACLHVSASSQSCWRAEKESSPRKSKQHPHTPGQLTVEGDTIPCQMLSLSRTLRDGAAVGASGGDEDDPELKAVLLSSALTFRNVRPKTLSLCVKVKHLLI